MAITKQCLNCNGLFSTYPSKIKLGKGKYCSKGCASATLFQNGHTPWHKGRTGVYTEETRRAMAASNLRGKLAKNWKGGVTSERHRAMAQTEYKVWRDSIFSRDNYTCQICYEYGTKLHADHIKEWSKYPSLRYEVSNGRTLCVPCHYYITYKRKMPKLSNWGIGIRRQDRG